MTKIKDLVVSNEFDYITKDDALNVQFYQVPKALLHIDVSAEAKLLYGFLKDRSSYQMFLSCNTQNLFLDFNFLKTDVFPNKTKT